MLKNEQSRGINQPLSIAPSAVSRSLPSLPTVSPTMFQTMQGVLSQRFIDPNAIDITSLKGQFAWEKLPQSDAYMPVIFRGETKYFCVRMLRKLLPDYPEDFIRRAHQYQYRKLIDLYAVTASETELLNRINTHHSRWAYARQPFNALDELVRVSDFLPLYEHLRHSYKVGTVISNSTVHTLRQLLPQSQTTVQRSTDYVPNTSIILRGQSTTQQDLPAQIQLYRPPTDFSREHTSRPIAVPPNVARSTRPSKSIRNPYAIVPIRPTQPYQTPQQPILSNNAIHSTNTTVPSIQNPNLLNTTSIPLISSTSSPSSSSSPIISTLTNDIPSCSSSPSGQITKTNRKSSVSPPTTTTTTTTTSSSPSLSSKTSPIHCGWLQINKLYTPYVSPSATNHHLYKIPVSLLSFYDLLKRTKTDVSDSADSSTPYSQTSVTSQEIELINDLCIKQNIKPFAVDTKLITLSTFYEYCSANILFVKELPLSEPKISICKDWPSIVQINGGICRLRNITTLNEQTVPFIGNNLLKNFILSSQRLSTATLSKPTAAELEFLQLILFFSNISINLCNAQLIDIESVQKEYNVDLILLFNDKFPLNVLNYQQQGYRSNKLETIVTTPNSTATTNTIAESTPPPSPPSPQSQTNTTPQLPSLTSTTNRYYKTIQFYGHSLTAYICSGLGSNSQRECVSIKSLCSILYPNSSILDKLEVKMLRLLRAKNINRFRPQNQQSIGFTRLIDVKDAKKHWNSLEKEMRSIVNDNEEIQSQLSVSSGSSDNLKASKIDRIDKNEELSSTPLIEQDKGEKRPMDAPLDYEDTPISERIHKRARIAEKENHELLDTKSSPIETYDTSNESQVADKSQNSTTKIIRRKLPSSRTNKKSKAQWVRKYDIEDCCIQLMKSDAIHNFEGD